MDDEWDGVERRSAMLADERTRANGQGIEAPTVIVVVGFVAVLLLQAGALIQHALLAHEHAEAERFRKQITCFVVSTVQGKSGTDLLATCDFLKIGG